MLSQLRIVDLALIEEAEVTLDPGFNVLTGETGAGKSIIVGAAALLRGGRASAELVRHGRKEAVVEALFELRGMPEVEAALAAAGLPGGEGELLVRRQISASGRGRVHVNGSLCTLGVLRGLMERVLDIAGQHEYQLLSDRAVHRQLLDSVALRPAQRQAMAEAHAELERAAEALAHSRMDDRMRAERIDFLRFQLRELEDAELRPGEEEELAQERQKLRRSAELIEAALSGERALYSGDDAVSDVLARVGRTLEGLCRVDPRMGTMAAQLAEAGVLVEDVGQALGRYAGDGELDPGRLDQVEERLDLIQRLRRKHGRTVEELIQRQQEMAEELGQLESLEQRLDALEAELARCRERAAEQAAALSALRHKAAVRLARQVNAHLTGLRMEGARLQVEVAPRARREGDDAALCVDGRRIDAEGWDRAELLIASNPGEPAKPLARIASGGELSRVMLALRRVLGEVDPVATSIYDEVDAGIGGAVADVVGAYLARVARHRQVLCVTHLPQVAAYADAHFHVGKRTRGKRTRTTVGPLADDQQRQEELARMLGGERITAEARANAAELLRAAAEAKAEK